MTTVTSSSCQVEVPGGRGKPSILVEKDEALDKVCGLVFQCLFIILGLNLVSII